MLKVWEFVDSDGYKWLITENADGYINLEIITCRDTLPDWEIIDHLKKRGKLTFVKERYLIEK